LVFIDPTFANDWLQSGRGCRHDLAEGEHGVANRYDHGAAAIGFGGVGRDGVKLVEEWKLPEANLNRYLFGDIVAIGWRGCVDWGGVFASVFGERRECFVVQLSSLTLLAAQEDMAHVCGVPVKRLNYLFVFVADV